ncbi:MAG: alpha/beta hydrolase [Verrucomicrobia bacterium]|nr:alpha/beta hydrolase [Verrucomicrobiota bacterium]
MVFHAPRSVYILAVALTTWHASAAAAGEASLEFDPARFTVKTLTLGNQSVSYRAYEGIIYVSKPVDTSYQSMNVYVPAAYFEGKAIGTYTAESAPIFLPNNVGGYLPGTPGTPGPDRSGKPNAVTVALAKGYVVAAPGARGRTSQDQDGNYTGRAPAAIVDLKAAVRYLRHNGKVLPGNAEKIIANGTSAGGALSALLGATGNQADYEPYLKAIGAADGRDDVFAASCYCPITNLDNADGAYEWMFNGINDYNFRGRTGALTADQVKVSDQLRLLFPPYLNGLRLKAADGTALSLDAYGNGSFRDHVKSFVIASAQQALSSGKHLSPLTWILIEGGKVKDIDFTQYVRFAGRMKPAPAFDALDLSAPENNLFGTATVDSQHFTQFSREHSADHSMAEAAIIRMMNPMNYIGDKGTTMAPHWRIRHGAIDRDTSLAIPVILTTKLRNAGFEVDFALPWDQGHGGDYDLDELFAWMEQVCH